MSQEESNTFPTHAAGKVLHVLALPIERARLATRILKASRADGARGEPSTRRIRHPEI